jgi:hypothetical protein
VTVSVLHSRLAGVPSHTTLHEDFVARAEANGWQVVEAPLTRAERNAGDGEANG